MFQIRIHEGWLIAKPTRVCDTAEEAENLAALTLLEKLSHWLDQLQKSESRYCNYIYTLYNIDMVIYTFYYITKIYSNIDTLNIIDIYSVIYTFI